MLGGMSKAEMLERMDSRELTGWMALLTVQKEERDEFEEQQRMKRESDDGEVIAYGKPRSAFDDEDDEITDGQAE